MPESEPAVPDGIRDLVTEVRLTQLPAPARRKRIRVDAGVSARKAARALGVDVMTLVRWEQGATPRPEHAIPYRRLLDGLEEVTS
jgi:DNA-binding transcriptional regulator YiaG